MSRVKEKNNMKTITYVLIFTSFVLFFNSCFEQNTPEMPDINVVDISEESDWTYWVVGHDDDFYIKEDDGALTGVMFHAGEANKYIPITFDENELPDKVVIDDYVFIFSNYEGYNVDIAVVSPNGDVEIIRDIQTSINWDNYLALGKSAQTSDLINWTGRVVGAIPCALSIASTVASYGATWPLTALICGNYVLQLANDIVTDELDIHNGITDFVDDWGLISTALTCSNPAQTDGGLSCAMSITSNVLDEWADNLEDLEESEDVQVAEGALESGSGDVQITLTWNTTDDIDLWVTDPSDEKIYYAHKNAESGGYLDYDDVNGYGPENVYWPEDGAPNGTYKVEVDHFDGYYNTNFTILIQAFGYVKTYYGAVGPDQTVTVATFNSNSPLPKNTVNEINYYPNNEVK